MLDDPEITTQMLVDELIKRHDRVVLVLEKDGTNEDNASVFRMKIPSVGESSGLDVLEGLRIVNNLLAAVTHLAFQQRKNNGTDKRGD